MKKTFVGLLMFLFTIGGHCAKPDYPSTLDTSNTYGQSVSMMYLFKENTGVTAYDLSGNSRNGTLTNAGVTWSTNDDSKPCLDIAVTSPDSYVDCGSATILATNQPFSIVARVWLDTYTESYPNIIAVKQSSDANLYQLAMSATPPYADIIFGSASGNWERYVASFTPNTSQWVHLVVTYNGLGATTIGNFKLYVNGVSKTIAVSGGFAGTSGNNLIGTSGGANTSWDGKFDYIYIYSKELSQADVTSLVADPYQMISTTNIKGIGGLAYASIKKVGLTAVADLKKIGGVQ